MKDTCGNKNYALSGLRVQRRTHNNTGLHPMFEYVAPSGLINNNYRTRSSKIAKNVKDLEGK
jgi:hypothetical protein